MVCDSGPRQKPRNPETPKPRNPETPKPRNPDNLLKKTPIIRLESLISICAAFMGVEITDAFFR